MSDLVTKQAAKVPGNAAANAPGSSSKNNNNIQRDIPISLGKPSLKRRLEAYYSLVNPDSVKDPVKWRSTIDQIYDKYGGSYEGERKLASKLAKKYGATVQLLLAESFVTKKKERTRTTQAPACNANKPREESWFELRPQEKDSGVIDFASDRFDPLAALQRREALIVQANPWIPTCPLLNHTGQFQSHLPKNDPLYKDLPAARPPKPVTDDNKPKKKTLGPFATLAEPHAKGPLSLLQRLFEQRQRIRVLVRYVNGIRGTVTGYLMAFDKHFNLLLRDVDEVYCPRPSTNAATSTLGEKEDTDNIKEGLNSDANQRSNLEVELDRRVHALNQPQHASKPSTSAEGDNGNNNKPSTWNVRQRHLKQILVRGDNVVMVYKAEAERSAWPRTRKSPTESVYKRKATVVPLEELVGTPGCLIYALQQQERRQTHQQQQSHRRHARDGQRQDYRSFKW